MKTKSMYKLTYIIHTRIMQSKNIFVREIDPYILKNQHQQHNMCINFGKETLKYKKSLSEYVITGGCVRGYGGVM